jgi:hypothetical protein
MICDETGKISYTTRSEAERSRSKIHSRPGGHACVAYACHFCNGYHIASKPRITMDTRIRREKAK